MTPKEFIPGYVSATEASAYLGKSREQTLRYVRGVSQSRLIGKRIGKNWAISTESLLAFVPPPRGNPLHRKKRKKK